MRRIILTIRKILAFAYLRWYGVETSFGYVSLRGWPIIKKHPGSRIVIGKGVTLNSDLRSNIVGLNHPVILATVSEKAIIYLDDNCGMSGSSIVAASSVQIGQHSGLGGNASIYDTDFHPIEANARRCQRAISDASTKPVTVGKDVLIGMNTIVLKGVTIGDGAFIGANSVVTQSIPSNTLWVGNPAHCIRKI